MFIETAHLSLSSSAKSEMLQHFALCGVIRGQSRSYKHFAALRRSVSRNRSRMTFEVKPSTTSNMFTALSRCLALSAVVLSGSLSVYAQNPLPTPTPTPRPAPAPQPSATPTLERRFFKNILRDQRAIWTSPLRLHREDAKWVLPLGVTTGTLIATDRQTADAIARHQTLQNVSHVISVFGSGYTTGGIAAAFYLLGRKKNDARARETGLLGGEALIDSGIVAAALKSATQRPRPRAGEDRGKFFHGGLSFPSGHAIAAWSLATIVANEYQDNRLIKIGAYGLATAVSVSRFTGHNHFLSDALVGSAIGYGIGRYVYRTRHDAHPGSLSQEPPHPQSKLPLIVPLYQRAARNYGVTTIWSF